jgi:ketosteroid isomerase-like protein
MKPSSRFAIALVPLVALLAGCQQEPHGASSHQAALDAIAETNAKTLQALNTNDLELMNSLVADNHIMMIPNRPELTGREAIIASNRNLVESWTNVEIWKPAETVVSGDWAYQRGAFDITLTPKKAGVRAIRSVGKYIHIYQRQPDGRWLMIRDIFNDNGAAAAQATAPPAQPQGEGK